MYIPLINTNLKSFGNETRLLIGPQQLRENRFNEMFGTRRYLTLIAKREQNAKEL